MSIGTGGVGAFSVACSGGGSEGREEEGGEGEAAGGEGGWVVRALLEHNHGSIPTNFPGH